MRARFTIPAWLCNGGKPLSGKAALITGGARRLGRAIGAGAGGGRGGCGHHFSEFRARGAAYRHRRREFRRPGCGFALRYYRRKERQSGDQGDGQGTGRDRYPGQQCRQLRNREFDQLTLKQWDAIFASNTRGPFLVSREALKYLRERRGKNHQHGLAGRAASLGESCSLLFFQSSGTHADEGDGQGPGAGDRGELRCAGDDRSGREGGGGVYEEDGATDADAAEWQGRGDCGGGFVFCDCAEVYYRADTGGGWRVGFVI